MSYPLTSLSKRILAGLAMAISAGAASAAVIEGFDSGSLQPGWNQNAGVITTDSAHDGTHGLRMSGGNWMINTTFSVQEGDTLSVWLRAGAGDGRFYLGFGADNIGTQSLVAAPNSNQFLFQINDNYGYLDVASSAQTYGSDWYKAVIDWSVGGSATGFLYGADGTTLLNSVSVSNLPRSSGGIALRGFGSWDIDTVSIEQKQGEVPEPASLALLGLGLAGVAAVRRKRKQ